MNCCRICGEVKEKSEFFCIPKFSQFKKKNWCRVCQKMYMDMIKAQVFKEKRSDEKEFYTVTFQ